jgi:aspartate kinase
MSTLVMKFAGVSVNTADALEQLISIVLRENQRWHNVVVVISALTGITDTLIETTELVKKNQRSQYHALVADIRTRHLDLVDQLPLQAYERDALRTDIDRLLFEMLDTCQNLAENGQADDEPSAVNAIIDVGEQLASRIVATLLRHHKLRGVAIDSTELLIIKERSIPDTTKTYTRIKSNLLPLLERDIIPVVTGFFAGTEAGQLTTLGRGGSDYTASILSVGTNADEMWMLTDVAGLMTADPKQIDTARIIPRMSYSEAAELAYFGAHILHTHMINPLREANIPLYVKSVARPNDPGTQVSRASAHPTQKVRAVTSIQGLCCAAERGDSLAGIVTLVNDTLRKTTGNSADVMITSQASSRSFVSFILPTTAGLDGAERTRAMLEERLQEQPGMDDWQVVPVTLVTAIGADLDKAPRLTAKIFAVLDDLPVLALSQGPSHCSFSVVVDSKHGPEALKRLHQLTTD